MDWASDGKEPASTQTRLAKREDSVLELCQWFLTLCAKWNHQGAVKRTDA